MDDLFGVSDVVWSGVFASTITLTGVFLSNRSNTRRLKLQLIRDGEERAKQRRSDLRRSVYLDAVEAIAKAHAHFARFPDLGEDESFSDGMEAMNSAVERVKLIAKLDTGDAITNYQTACMEVYCGCLLRAAPILKLNAELDEISASLVDAQAKIKKIDDAISQTSQQLDIRKHSALKTSLNSEKSHLNSLHQARAVLLKEITLLKADYGKTTLEKVNSLVGVTAKSLALMRNELEIEGDGPDTLARLEKRERESREVVALTVQNSVLETLGAEVYSNAISDQENRHVNDPRI